MQPKIKQNFYFLFGVISLSILAGSFNPSFSETLDSKPLEQIEFEIEEAVVARDQSTVELDCNRICTVSTLQQKTILVSSPPYFAGHRFANGLMAPMIV